MMLPLQHISFLHQIEMYDIGFDAVLISRIIAK